MTTPLSRRDFLALVAATAAAGALGCSNDGSSTGAGPGTTAGSGVIHPAPDLPSTPFTLGVASGDPLADRAILWTRLAPKPLEGAGGMPDQPVTVTWEVARDDSFGDIVRTGTFNAEARLGHSVHVDADGLEPDSRYAYRFKVGDHTSPVGRTRTAPRPGVAPKDGRLKLGFGSCQEWSNGFYTAYPHLVAEGLDVMVWLGDYMYEDSFVEDLEKLNAGAAPEGKLVRNYVGGTPLTLDEYRTRYAMYTGDENLQAARAAQPWIVLWDDHEVENNYAADTNNSDRPRDAFLAQRAAAYQAWWENQPVRMPPPNGPDLQVYRRFEWGDLASFYVLDERQYRSPQICDNALDVGDCADRLDPERSLLGAAQKRWLLDELDRSTTTWNVLGNEVIMVSMPVLLTGEPLFNLDQWDGFPVEQREVLEKFASKPDLNPIVITGDIHAYGVGQLKVDPKDPAAKIVGTEFVGGSVTSSFFVPGDAKDLIGNNPDVIYANGKQHGYAVLELTATEARCRFRAVETIKEQASPIATIAEFAVDAGKPGARAV